MNGAIDHTPATFVIDPNGRESRLYLTEMAYSSVNQLGDELAQSIAALLPGHPRLHGDAARSPSRSLYGPHDPVTLPRAGGGVVRLGPGSGAHLVLFFDTWETEVTDLSAQLEALNRYQATAEARGAPAARRDRRGRSRGVAAGTAALPARSAPPARVSRSSSTAAAASPTATACRTRPGSSSSRATGRFLLLRGPRREGLADARQLVAQVQAAQAHEVKTFRRICTNLPEVAARPVLTHSGAHERGRRSAEVRHHAERERPHSATAAPIDGSSHFPCGQSACSYCCSPSP